MSNNITRQRRRTELHRKQDGRCCYCRGPMAVGTVHPPVPYMVTIEHLRQGDHPQREDLANLRAACYGCNQHRPKQMDPARYAMLRILLLPAWPACTLPAPHIARTLVDLWGPGLHPKKPRA